MSAKSAYLFVQTSELLLAVCMRVYCMYCKRTCLCVHLPVSPLFHLCHFKCTTTSKVKHGRRFASDSTWDTQPLTMTNIMVDNVVTMGQRHVCTVKPGSEADFTTQNRFLEYECCFSGFSAKRGSVAVLLRTVCLQF